VLHCGLPSTALRCDNPQELLWLAWNISFGK